MSEKYKVFVDDNYHYSDEGERYAVGAYDSLKEALEKREEISIKSLVSLLENGITPDQLHTQCLMFTEHPFIDGALCKW